MILRRADGFSIFELMVVLALGAILSAVAANNLTELNDPVQNGANQFVGFLKQARSKAISTTSAYIVEPDGPNRLITRVDTTCNAGSAVDDPLLTHDFTGVTMADTSWSICFTSRGFPDDDLTLAIGDGHRSKTVELFLGGGARVQ